MSLFRYPNLSTLLFPVLAEIVEARNVANLEDIEAFLKDKKTNDTRIDKWLETTLRKYIIRDYDATETVEEAEPDSPDWLKKSLEKGEEVVNVIVTRGLEEKIAHIIDWLKADVSPRKLDALSFPDALKQSEEWLEAIKKKKVNKDIALEGEQVVKTFEDGYTWKKLTSKDALNLEGQRMGHCVGSYFDRVSNGTIIYSLRDPKNEPHCTIEVTGGRVKQIKGKENKAVVQRYQKYVQEFIKTDLKDLEVDPNELANMGLIKLDDALFSMEDILADPTILEGHDLTSSYLSEQLFGAGFIVVKESELVPTATLAQNPEGLLKVGKEIFTRRLEKDDKLEVRDGALWVFGVYPEDFMARLKDISVKVDLPSTEDFDYNGDHSFQYEDVEALIESLKKKYPKTYKKIQKEIEKVIEEVGSEPSSGYQSGDWFYKNREHFSSEFISAISSAVYDGAVVGTQDSLYKMVSRELQHEFADGSYTVKDEGLFYFVLPVDPLLEFIRQYGTSSYYAEDAELGKNWTYDNEYSEEAAIESFPDRLSDDGYLEKEPEKKKSKKAA